MDFRLSVPFEKREAYSQHIRNTFPGKYGIIVQPYNSDEINILSKYKFVVDGNSSLGVFKIKAFRQSFKSSHGLIFICINRSNQSVMLVGTTMISTLYERYANEDGLLYIYYLKENTFG